jgi:hypothetical protein
MRFSCSETSVCWLARAVLADVFDEDATPFCRVSVGRSQVFSPYLAEMPDQRQNSLTHSIKFEKYNRAPVYTRFQVH